MFSLISKSLVAAGMCAVLVTGAQAQPARSAPSVLAPAKPGLVPVPLPALDSLEPSVTEQIKSIQESYSALAAGPQVTAAELAAAYGTLGQLYHSYEFTDAAQSCYLNARRLAPRDYRWAHLLGQLSQKAGRLEKSLAYYKAARKMNAEYVATAVNLGSVYIQLNQLEAARTEFEGALKSAPDSAAAHNGLGEAALAERRYSEAIPHFQAALKRASRANRIHYSLAMAYRGLGDLEKARAHLKLRGPVGVRPGDPLVDGLQGLLRGERVHLIRGRLAFGAGRFEEAAEAFAKAAEADPSSTRARVNLGTALAKMGRPGGALEQYLAVLRMDPQHLTAHFNVGTMMVRKGEHSRAVEHFESIVKLNPNDLEANRELAKSLTKVERNDEALPYFSRVVKLAPDDEASLISLADLLAGKERYSETRDLLEQANRRFPKRARTAVALARLLAACPDPGLRDGERALELATRAYNATKLLRHGEAVALALAELGRCEEAAAWQSRFVAAAERARELELVARLKQELERYKGRHPCAPPARQGVVPP